MKAKTTRNLKALLQRYTILIYSMGFASFVSAIMSILFKQLHSTEIQILSRDISIQPKRKAIHIRRKAERERRKIKKMKIYLRFNRMNKSNMFPTKNYDFALRYFYHTFPKKKYIYNII